MNQTILLQKAKFKKELANELGLSIKTFQRKLHQLGIEVPRGLVTPQQQYEIYQKMGAICPEMTSNVLK